jgi:hypothetical protein
MSVWRKLFERIGGFFNCTNLVRDCVMPKEAKLHILSSEKKREEIADRLEQLKEQREDLDERTQKMILTVNGDLEWFKKIERENNHV